MAQEPNSLLRYIKLDFDAHRDAILDRVRSRWSQLWNDFVASSFGILIVDLIAWSTATVAFIINRVAGENFVSTMTLRESALRLGSLVNYKLRGATAATLQTEADMAATVGAVGDPTTDVLIAEGTPVRSTGKADVTFEVSRDYVILSGFTTPVIPIVFISGVVPASDTDVIESNAAVTEGEVFVDLLNSTFNLKEFISIGQTFQEVDDNGVPFGPSFKIQNITSSPGGISNNRLVLDRGWEGPSGVIDGWVYDTRIGLVEGQTITERFATPSVEVPNLRYQINQTPLINNSLKVEVNGKQFSRVPSLSVEGADDNIFEERTLDDGSTILIFGDNVFGSTVPADAIVIVRYRIGGGQRGNVEAGTILTSITGNQRASNRPVSINVSNAGNTGTGGADQETLEEARVNIPAYTRTNDRAVTLEDYRTMATGFSTERSVVRFVRADVRIQNSLLEGNLVILYAWTTGDLGNLIAINQETKNALETFMRTKAVGTDFVLVADGDALPLPVALRYKVLPGFDIFQVESGFRSAIQDTVNGLVPGDEVVFSDFIATLDAVPGVDSVTPATPVDSLAPANQNEIFSSPNEDFEYEVALTSVSGLNKYTAQMPVTPLAAWSFRVFLDDVELTVIPDSEPGFARILGENIPDVREGPLGARPEATVFNSGSYYFATDIGVRGTLYRSEGVDNWIETANPEDVQRSRVDLRTGAVVLNTKRTVGTFKMSLVTVQFHEVVRKINLFIGYKTTDTSQEKRREVRRIIRQTISQMRAGQTLFSQRVDGLQSSNFNVTDIVSRIKGVTSVERVALDTPANNALRIDAPDAELISAGQIIINNASD